MMFGRAYSYAVKTAVEIAQSGLTIEEARKIPGYLQELVEKQISRMDREVKFEFVARDGTVYSTASSLENPDQDDSQE